MNTPAANNTSRGGASALWNCSTSRPSPTNSATACSPTSPPPSPTAAAGSSSARPSRPRTSSSASRSSSAPSSTSTPPSSPPASSSPAPATKPSPNSAPAASISASPPTSARSSPSASNSASSTTSPSTPCSRAAPAWHRALLPDPLANIAHGVDLAAQEDRESKTTGFPCPPGLHTRLPDSFEVLHARLRCPSACRRQPHPPPRLPQRRLELHRGRRRPALLRLQNARIEARPRDARLGARRPHRDRLLPHRLRLRLCVPRRLLPRHLALVRRRLPARHGPAGKAQRAACRRGRAGLLDLVLPRQQPHGLDRRHRGQHVSPHARRPRRLLHRRDSVLPQRPRLHRHHRWRALPPA